jgi:hypothetical protein
MGFSYFGTKIEKQVIQRTHIVQTMKKKRKKVLWIGTDISYLEMQKKNLSNKELDSHLYSFCNVNDAFDFIEKQIIEKHQRIHYVLIEEALTNKKVLSYSLEKFNGLDNFLEKPEIIVLTNKNSSQLRNNIMQYRSVSSMFVKPIPSGYLEFLITGHVV